MRNVSGTYTFTENTNIRTAPSLSAPVVGTYYPGDSVTYTGQVNAERYIWLQYLSGSGNTRYVATSGTSAQYNTNNISGTFTFTQQTNIRTAPSTSASIVGVYYPGDSVIYNAQITADGYNTFLALAPSAMQ
ncbi:SH3 domain-containing protein [Lactiplantibacillus plantarum]|uniref:SH3 domain-containing protein n=1 Tax=Lactiplantibacillus plantarum TaxID=1590 RepID=UPI0020C15B30|nr:SH3 domain-containing protein [Lactiplantibacillus plantarum]MCK8449742.1 SH3 domain-containing protein [Lactiplantibacillus plantarum]